MNIQSPKARFLKTHDAKEHFDLVVKPSFQAAIDATMLQFVEMIGTANDPAGAAERHYMLAGAKAFRNLLLRIADAETESKPTKGDNLPHI